MTQCCPHKPDRGLSAERGDRRRDRLCVVVAVSSSIQVIYRGRLEYLQAHGFDVTVVCSPSESDDAIRARGVRLHSSAMPRAISPWADLRAIVSLWRFLRRERFDLIEVSFPKSALVGSIAGWLARASCVVHVIHGLVYEGRRGWIHAVLRISALIPCRLAHRIISVSASARELAYASGVARHGSIAVLGAGSYTGVDVREFSPEQRVRGAGVRSRCQIPLDKIVVGFVGRLNVEKGVVELVDAFRELCAERDDLILLLVGDYEQKQQFPEKIIEYVKQSALVRLVGWQDDTVPFYAAMDMLVLPSHHEGFGNVLPEAAAMGLPTIASDATGCVDAMRPGITGLQFPVGDVPRLRDAIRQLADDPELRRRLGENGRRWVVENLDRERVWRLYLDEYRRLIETHRR